MPRLAAIVRLVNTERRADGELLREFLTHRDEAAFVELVRRHGPLVWGVCRRSLPDAADAEDAFQATFLVLVRKADRLTREPTVGPWLYRVAAWTARNLRRKNARRLARTVTMPDIAVENRAEPAFDLDAAMLALPEKYRTPLVLCHLHGLTRREAAERLGCPEGTLSARLSRGLAKLRAKLLGRDPLPLLTAATAGGLVPSSITIATERAALAFAVASLIPAATGPAAALANGVLRMFWVKKVATVAVVATVMIGVAGVTIGVGIRGRGGVVVAQEKTSNDVVKQQAREEINMVNSYLARIEKRKKLLQEQENGIKEQIQNAELDMEFQRDKLERLRMIEKHNDHIEVLVANERSIELQKKFNEKYEANFQKALTEFKNDPKAVANLTKQLLQERRALEEKLASANHKTSPYHIYERSPFGSKVLEIAAINDFYLTVQLKRVFANPIGTRDLVVRVESDAKWESLEKALKAANAAGFTKARVLLEPDSPIRLTNVKKKVPSAGFYDEFDVENLAVEIVGPKPPEKPKP